MAEKAVPNGVCSVRVDVAPSHVNRV